MIRSDALPILTRDREAPIAGLVQIHRPGGDSHGKNVQGAQERQPLHTDVSSLLHDVDPDCNVLVHEFCGPGVGREDAA